jgi:hypothetical protein
MSEPSNQDQNPLPGSGPATSSNITSTVAASSSSATGFYKQALSMCHRFIEAGLLHEAISWAQQADEISSLLESEPSPEDVENAYARIMLQACLRSQERALITGNILPEHEQLASVLNTASERLSARLKATKRTEPRVVALVAHRYVSRHKERLADFFSDTQIHRYSSSADLDTMLESLSHIQQCAEQLCSDEKAGVQPFDRKLLLAETVVSNARYSLSRLFSSKLSDWSKAEFFCKRAYLLLTTQSINNPSTTSLGNAELDRAVSVLPTAYEALQRRHYKDSNKALLEAETGLKRATQSN